MSPGIIEDAIIWLTNLLANIVTTIGDFLVQLWTWVVDMLDALINGLWDLLSGIFVVIQEGLASLFTAIEETLVGIVNQVADFLAQAWETIYEATIGVLDTIQTFATQLASKLETFVGNIIDTVSGFIEGAVDWVQSVVTAGLEAVADVAVLAAQKLTEFAAPLLDWVQGALVNISTLINAAWEALVFGTQAIIDAIGEKLVGLRDAFADAATEVVESITGLAEEQLGPIRQTITEFVEAYLPKDDPAITQRALSAIDGLHTDPSSMRAYRAYWEGEARRLGEAGPLRKGIYLTAFFLLSLIPLVMGISNVLSQTVIQEYSKEFPFQILSPGDASAAWRRGLITQGEAVGEIRRAGFDERKAEFIAKLTSNVPGEPALLRMWWRRIIDDVDLEKALRHQGLDDPWPVRIMEAARVLPPIQDLIQMAVRDVWNPAAVQLGGLEEIFPEQLAVEADKQGLSEDWALKYWAAHWRLPSIQQAFEMRHRDVIGDEQLDTLLQALDVAPGWREPITAIAFNPYTRVDIRRMHRIGVLDEEQVLRAYRDLGYDDEKAEGLTEFTKILNEPKGVEDDAELGQLSRTAVLGFYEDGLLERPRAAELLVTAGHTPEAAQLYLDASDAGEERSERKTETALLIELAQAGSLTFDEAEDKLRGLGLETKEVERAVTKLLRARQRKTRLPSKGDADAFFAAGLLKDPEYEDLLGRIGYSPKWTAMYLQLVREKRG